MAMDGELVDPATMSAFYFPRKEENMSGRHDDRERLRN